jgi:RNase H-like domain found in reverse transcriptase
MVIYVARKGEEWHWKRSKVVSINGNHEVLRWLRAHDLYLRPEKCEFDRDEIEYLGLIIRKGEVSMDPVKVKAVTDWPTPRNLRELRGFLGFKDVLWTWGVSQRLAFQTLKESFSQKPILAVWEPNRPTRLEVDASGYATGGVLLLQKLEDDLWHPVAFQSQSMVEAERNYEIYDKEMLAIVHALRVEDWRHYLEA